jgi:outer membrane receptor protein involved in Fe transport
MKRFSTRGMLVCSTAVGAVLAPPAAAQVGTEAQTTQEAASAEPAAGAGEILVTGSRIKRDGFQSPVPLTVVGAELIENLGQTNAADVIKLIPQNIASQSDANSGVGLSANAGSQFANLRGLNPTFGTRTLTLVNSRRFVPSSDGGQVDLNLVPSVMIGRVETVTGGASAAYGSDAVAGVVNVILDNNLKGLKAQIDYGITDKGDGRNYHAAAAYGLDFAEGRGRLMIGGEYQRNRGIEKCFSARKWCADGWTVVTNEATIRPGTLNVLPGSAANTSGYNVPGSPGFGQPNYVLGRDGALVYNSPFGVIRNFATAAGNSATAFNAIFPAIAPPLAAIDKVFNPAGTAVSAFDPGLYGPKAVGSLALGGDNSSAYADQYIQTPLERYTTYLSGEYELTDALKISGELTYAERKANSRSLTAGTRSTMAIKPDNAYLPASVAALLNGQAFSLGKDLDDQLENRITVDAEVFRSVIALSGDLLPGWTWEAYYQYGRNKRTSSVRYSRNNDAFVMALDAVRNPANPNQVICRPLSPTVLSRFSTSYQAELNALYANCRPLNLFGTGAIDPAAVAFAWQSAGESFKYRQHVASGSVQGTLFDGWGAGPIGVAAGFDYRDEGGDVTHGDVDPSDYAFSFGLDYAGKIRVIEGFLEANVPVFRDSPIGRFLELNGAVRYTKNKSTDTLIDQSRSLNATSWKVGGVYDVVDSIRLRATQSRDIRAAGFRELFQKTAPSEAGTAQGRVNNLNISGPNQVDDTPIFNGGNFTLAPEKADTTTAGIVLTPSFLTGFRMSLDWYQIKLADAIANLPAQRVVDLCINNQLLCERITFASPSNITRVNAGQSNVGKITVRGFDFEASYRLQLADVASSIDGNLDLRFLLNHQYDFAVQQNPAVAAVDYGGQSGPVVDGGDFYPTPKWMWNTIVSYGTDRFNATATIRHVGKGALSKDRIGPEDDGYSPTLRNSISTNRVKSATYVNLALSYAVPFGSDPDDAVELFGSVENLFDKAPPVAPGGGVAAGATAYPTNPVFFDTFGRRFRVGTRVRF